ncbi:MAG TPA: Nif3-like dinuclear metal center hexameric protein [Baekduia sp.]|nr:Nif3-like dinuclear metal center hexameric protein [Baekduia sp.]
MAAPLGDLIRFLDELLHPESFDDYCPNGLQVPGTRHVETVVTGVSAHAELFDRAIARDADLVLVHHGLFWKGQPLEITAAMHLRLGKLFANDIALAAYHLPLDAHAAHGNNALLAGALGLDQLGPLGDIGFRGVLAEPMTLKAFGTRVAAAVGGRVPLVIDGGDHTVSDVGIVTGAGTDYIAQALAAGCDTFVTGEPAERAYATAKDNAIHFIAAGHHATETFGVKRLGELLAARFSLEHHFEDVENPI